MIRRLPILPTIIVLIAVAIMIGLGVWQLQRAAWKENLLAHYNQALTLSSDASFPTDAAAVDKALYRHARVDCRAVQGGWNSVAGRNAKGDVGYVHIAQCDIGGGASAYVQVGWTQSPEAPVWAGGEVLGFIAPYNQGVGARLIAAPPVAGLQASATPNPADIPNNHMGYAMQWFFFAATALAIYLIAVWKRLRGVETKG